MACAYSVSLVPMAGAPHSFSCAAAWWMLLGNTVLSSEDADPEDTSSLPSTPRGPVSPQHEFQAGDVLPSLNNYLFGAVGLHISMSAPAPFSTPTAQQQPEESLPGTSPIPSSPLTPFSSQVRMAETRAQENSIPPALPPLSTDGIIPSSTIIGTKEERLPVTCRKSHRKQALTVATQKVVSKQVSEESKTVVFDEILNKLRGMDSCSDSLCCTLLLLRLWPSSESLATRRIIPDVSWAYHHRHVHLRISESYQNLTHKPRTNIGRHTRRVSGDDKLPAQTPSTPIETPADPYLSLDPVLISSKMEGLLSIKPSTLCELSSSMRSFARVIASKACHECGSPASHRGLTRENTRGKLDPRVWVPVAMGHHGSE
ncbi:hypothetical protein B0H10DRAFT_1950258 [Mycena sp. CBHHK59/15]|nr:hypothetical protein B0H10DRAFT_1950258 [Mycena sp. CBHHK59/15]